MCKKFCAKNGFGTNGEVIFGKSENGPKTKKHARRDLGCESFILCVGNKGGWGAFWGGDVGNRREGLVSSDMCRAGYTTFFFPY